MNIWVRKMQFFTSFFRCTFLSRCRDVTTLFFSVCVCVCVHAYICVKLFFFLYQNYLIAQKILSWDGFLKNILFYFISGKVRIILRAAIKARTILPWNQVSNYYTSIHIYIYIYIYILSSPSAYHTASPDFPDSISPFFPIAHRSWDVFQTTLFVNLELMLISSDWSMSRSP